MQEWELPQMAIKDRVLLGDVPERCSNLITSRGLGINSEQ
jgi:hypothetical protein